MSSSSSIEPENGTDDTSILARASFPSGGRVDPSKLAMSGEDVSESEESGAGMQLRKRPRKSLRDGFDSDFERAIAGSSSEDEDEEQEASDAEMEDIANDDEGNGGASSAVKAGRGGRGGARGGGAARGRGRGAGGRGASSTRGRGGSTATPASSGRKKKRAKGSDDDDDESDFVLESESESLVEQEESASEQGDESESIESPSEDERRPKGRKSGGGGGKGRRGVGRPPKRRGSDSDLEEIIEVAEVLPSPKKRGQQKSKYARASGDEEEAAENGGTAEAPGAAEDKPKRTYRPPDPAEQTAESLADPDVQRLTEMIKAALEDQNVVVPAGGKNAAVAISTPKLGRPKKIPASSPPKPASTPKPRGRPRKNPLPTGDGSAQPTPKPGEEEAAANTAGESAAATPNPAEPKKSGRPKKNPAPADEPAQPAMKPEPMDDEPEEPAVPAPKGRGRPRKGTAGADEPAPVPAPAPPALGEGATSEAAAEAPKGRGRPRKSTGGEPATPAPAEGSTSNAAGETTTPAPVEAPKGRGRGRKSAAGVEEPAPAPAPEEAPPAEEPVIPAPAAGPKGRGRGRQSNVPADKPVQPTPEEPAAGAEAGPADPAQEEATEANGTEEIVKVFKMKMADKRYRCYVPTCTKTFLNVEGIKYHSSHYVHEIVHILLFLFPKSPADKTKPSEETAKEPEALLPLIRDDVRELYESLKPYALPIKITDYPPLFPDTKTTRPLPIILGKCKERLEFAKPPKTPRPRKEKAAGEGEEGEDDDEATETARRESRRSVAQEWDISEEPLKEHVKDFKCAYDEVNDELLAERFVHRTLRPRVSDFTLVDGGTAEAHFPVRPEATVMFRKSSKQEPSSFSVKRFESCAVDGKGRRGFVLNASGAVWSLQWCPTVPGKKAQYLAIGTRKTNNETHDVLADRKPEPGCIQLWKIPPSSGKNNVPVLDLCILHDFGTVWDLCWCPYGGYESELPQGLEDDVLPRLGILAAAFADGSVRTFAIPHPDALKSKLNVEESEPLYVRHRPFGTIETSDHYLWRISWGGHSRLAAASTDGCIGVWSVDELVENASSPQDAETASRIRKGKNVVRDSALAVSSSVSVTYPTHFFQAHDTTVSMLDWNDGYRRMRDSVYRENVTAKNDGCPWPPEEPNEIVSSSYDGRIVLTDIRNPLNRYGLYRQRDFQLNVCAIPQAQGLGFSDADGIVRYCTPLEDDPKKKKAEEDDIRPAMTRSVMLHAGAVWDIKFSLLHPFLASASADGSVMVANVGRLNRRAIKSVQITTYRLHWDEEKKAFLFAENVGPQELKVETKRWRTPLFAREEVAIHRLSWNSSLGSESLLASGGAAGLVRVDDLYT